MSVNVAIKQKLLDKIESLSEDQMSNVLQFVDSFANLKDQSKHITDKPWQPCDPCDPYDAIEKLTLLLETDKLNNYDYGISFL